MIEIWHYEFCHTDRVVRGRHAVRGTLIRSKKRVPPAVAILSLQNDKKVIHLGLGHVIPLHQCKEGPCGLIQSEIDSITVRDDGTIQFSTRLRTR